MKHQPSILPDLLLSFMKIGLFTFGGGYAMISMIEHTCVEQKGWITHDDMMNVTIIAESTPGPIAINCATFVGYQQAGFIGAFVATFGVVLPSFLIIFFISTFFSRFLEVTAIAKAFQGIKIAVGLLVLDAAATMIKKMPKKSFPKMVMLCSFTVMLLINIFSWSFSSISLMLTAAIVSLGLFCIGGAIGSKGGEGK